MPKRGTRLEDLAQLASVSVATVSRALNDHPAVNTDTKQKIWKLAREHNYRFRPSMPALISGAHATIAVVIPPPRGRHGHATNPFFQELLGGVAEAARAKGCDVLVSHLSPGDYDDLKAIMTTNRSSGVVFLGQSFLHERLNRLAKTETRFIAWGSDLSGQTYCSVGTDGLLGGEKATAHLIRLGRRRIAFLGDIETPEGQQRYDGYIAAHHAAGLETDPELTAHVSFEIESAEAGVQKLLASGLEFDGIFGASDLIALGAIRRLIRAGHSVPEDVSVVGYDNVQMSAYARPALTTVSQDMAKAGVLLVSKLLEAPAGVRLESERLPTDLIVRESCGA